MTTLLYITIALFTWFAFSYLWLLYCDKKNYHGILYVVPVSFVFWSLLTIAIIGANNGG